MKREYFIFFLLALSLTNFFCGHSKKKSSAIHSFNGENGATPKGTLTLVDDKLYGYTSAGGKHNKGVIFRVDTTGKNYTVLYNYEDGSSNGLGKESHHDAMLFLNGTLYGAALFGGDNNSGVIFKINPDGTGYAPLHIFKGGNDDGSHPHSGVIVIDSVLYGLTAEGGKGGKGTIYKMNPDGSDFSVLYSFDKETGHNPHGRLTLGSDRKTLYGITKTGGSDNFGVIFSFNPNDSLYKVLHTFKSDKSNGTTTEHGYLVRNENKLFGLTKMGGANNKGVIYSLNEDGSDFQLLHSFGDKSGDGKSPFGSLIYNNGFLYGTTQEGGENEKGSIFRISPDGKIYEIIHSYETETSGEYPIDNVIFNKDGTIVYCYGQQGGEFDDNGKKKFGTIIRINPDEVSRK